MCPDERFECGNGQCISGKWRCDGYNGCINKRDEENCCMFICFTKYFTSHVPRICGSYHR